MSDAGSSSQGPNTRTPLLSSSSRYLASDSTCNSPLTPLDTNVPEGTWWQSLRAEFRLAWELGCCLCPFRPCRWLRRAAGACQSRTNSSHLGIVYLYVLLCCTIVFNLVEWKLVKNPVDNETVAEQVRQYFVIGCMALAIVQMLYFFLFTYGGVEYENYNHDAPMRIFFEAGLYLFGLVSMIHAIGLGIDYTCCGANTAAIVHTMKALFIVSQALFLNRFYKARINRDTYFVNIVFAHLFGTNLALWFWTLCTEVTTETTTCEQYPVNLDNVKKYLSPLFVEYLIIAASIIYEMWKSFAETPQQCRLRGNTNLAENQRVRGQTNDADTMTSFRQRCIPSCRCGMVLGSCFAGIFLVLILASYHEGKEHAVYFTVYSFGALVLYLSEIIASCIVQVSIQTAVDSAANHGQLLLDHDVVLLYISLGGILLWEGFHMFSLILKGRPDAILSIIVDFVGCVQHLFQAVTLVGLRRNRNPNENSAMLIRECVIFLLITNIGWWVQDSFILDAIIEQPGENHADLKQDLESFGYVLKPMTIFFRFHSATCFYHAWSTLKAWPGQ